MNHLFFCVVFICAAFATPAKVLAAGQPGKFVRGVSYSSPFGKRKKITLPDKTEVILNSNTTLWLDKGFGKSNRKVQLTGDALFTIKKFTTVFIIYTPHLILTTAEATARVNGYEEVAGEETSLLSGKMKVVKSYYSALDHEPYFLNDGDMVMMNKDIDLMEKETFDVGNLKSWISGKIVFNKASLSDVIKTLKGWFNVEIEVQGLIRGEQQFSGTLPGDDLQAVLGSLRKTWKYTYQAHRNTVTLKF